MKILHIDSGKDWRGGQRQVLALHEGLLKREIESMLVCNLNGKLYEIAKSRETKNVFHYDPRRLISLEGTSKIKQLIKCFNPNIIHCHDSKSVLYGSLLKGRSKLFHTRRVSYKISYLSRKIKYKFVDVHIGVSNQISQYLKRFFTNVCTIYSCIDMDRFKNITKSIDFDYKKYNILFVGAFSAQKGIDILILAFQRVLLTNPNTVLHLVGDGELRISFHNQVKKLGIENKVIFHGSQTNIERFYLSSNLVVFPSVSGEGSSGVIKEAIVAGKTIIVSDLDCNKDIVKDRVNGLTFRSKDYVSLTEKIISCINNPEIISKVNLKNSVTKFSCEIMIEKYEEIYTKHA